MNAITKNPLALTLATAIIYHFRGMALDAKDRTKAQSADLAAHPDAFEIVESRIKQADGTIAIPDSIDMGVCVDEEFIAAHRVN